MQEVLSVSLGHPVGVVLTNASPERGIGKKNTESIANSCEEGNGEVGEGACEAPCV